MIGELPKELEVGGVKYGINTDYRVMLLIFTAFSDPELTDEEKAYVCLHRLYKEPQSIPRSLRTEAIRQAYWFADGGVEYDEDELPAPRILDWEQDEKIIFSAVNHSAGFEVREREYLHWWTFLGYFTEIGDGVLTQVINIRRKKAKGRKLEKWEEEYLRENRRLVELRTRYTKEELEQQERLKTLLD